MLTAKPHFDLPAWWYDDNILLSLPIVIPNWPEKSQLKDRKWQEAEGASFSYLLNNMFQTDITFFWKWKMPSYFLFIRIIITFDSGYSHGSRRLIDSCDVLTPFDTAGAPPTPSPTCCFQTTCCNHVRWSWLVVMLYDHHIISYLWHHPCSIINISHVDIINIGCALWSCWHYCMQGDLVRWK